MIPDVNPGDVTDCPFSCFGTKISIYDCNPVFTGGEGGSGFGCLLHHRSSRASFLPQIWHTDETGDLDIQHHPMERVGKSRDESRSSMQPSSGHGIRTILAVKWLCGIPSKASMSCPTKESITVCKVTIPTTKSGLVLQYPAMGILDPTSKQSDHLVLINMMIDVSNMVLFGQGVPAGKKPLHHGH